MSLWNTCATAVVPDWHRLPLPSLRPDGQGRHGLHAGQRQNRRAVANAGRHPADQERLLYRHVSSGGPQVLIVVPAPPTPCPPPGLGGWRIGTSVLHYHRWRYIHTQAHTVCCSSLIPRWWGGLWGGAGGLNTNGSAPLKTFSAPPTANPLTSPFTCWAPLRLLLPCTVNQTPVLSQYSPPLNRKDPHPLNIPPKWDHVDV